VPKARKTLCLNVFHNLKRDGPQCNYQRHYHPITTIQYIKVLTGFIYFRIKNGGSLRTRKNKEMSSKGKLQSCTHENSSDLDSLEFYACYKLKA